MATIRERIDANGKKSYHVQIRLKGFPPQTQSFDSKTTAKQWAQHVETELRTGRYMPHAVAQRHTVREMLETYRDRVLRPLKPKRVRDQGQQLAWWIEKIGAYSLADISPAIIGKYRDELLTTPFGAKNQKNRAPATVVRYLALLSHAFSVAVKEWEWLPESPVAKVKKPKIDNGRVRYLLPDELERLRAAAALSANPFLATIIEVALSTGMRYSEIMYLRWRDLLIDADGHCLVVLEETKNGERRGVPLTGRGLAGIDALRGVHLKTHHGKVKGEVLLFPSKSKADTPVELRKSWETTLKRAEIDNFRFHDLRHTTASYLAMNRASLLEIAKVLGHKSSQMSMRYTHLCDQHSTDLLHSMNQAYLGGTQAPPQMSSQSDSKVPDAGKDPLADIDQEKTLQRG